MKKYAFGVDVGGTTIKLGLFTVAGELLDAWEIPTRTEEEGRHILEDIAETVDKKLEGQHIARQDVAGIGIGVPGPVGADGTVYRCVNLGWGVLNVEKQLSTLTDLPVKAGNDANVAALGEMWQGGGKGYKDVVMITLGTGVGGGVILDGKILPGARGAAGEIGHMPMAEPEEEPEACGCGKHGCLEQYASANGIVRVTKRYLAAHPDEPSSLRSMEKFTSKEIFDAARSGDAVALSIVNNIGQMLGKACAVAACMVDPEVFVLGGGMAKAGDILLDTVHAGFQKYAFHAHRQTAFALATLSNDAGIYGSVKMVL